MSSHSHAICSQSQKIIIQESLCHDLKIMTKTFSNCESTCDLTMFKLQIENGLDLNPNIYFKWMTLRVRVILRVGVTVRVRVTLWVKVILRIMVTVRFM